MIRDAKVCYARRRLAEYGRRHHHHREVDQAGEAECEDDLPVREAQQAAAFMVVARRSPVLGQS